MKFWTFVLTYYIWNTVNAKWKMEYFFWYFLNIALRKFSNSNIGRVNAIQKNFVYLHRMDELFLASNSTFMTDSKYLSTIQICQNLNEHYHYLVLTTSVILQIDADCSPFQSLNMFPFHIRLENLKLIYYV